MTNCDTTTMVCAIIGVLSVAANWWLVTAHEKISTKILAALKEAGNG